MPALPINPLQARSLVPEAPATPQRGAGVAGLVSSVAGLAAGIAGHIQHERDAEDNLAITNATSRLRVAAAEGMNDDGSPDGMAERIAGRFDKALQGEYARMSPRAQRMFGERQGVQMLADVRARAADAERGARQAKVRVDFDDGVQADARAAFADPSQAVDIMARRLASTDLLPLPEAERDALKSRARQSIASTALATDIQRDPDAVVRRLSQSSEAILADPVLSSLPAHQLTTALQAAQTAIQRRNNEGRYRVESQAKDVQAMVLTNVSPPKESVPTKEQYIAIYGQDGATRWQQDVGMYLELDGGLQQMRAASAADRQALVEGATPQPGAGFAVNLQKRTLMLQAKQIVEKQIIDDPAAYAIQNSPLVREAQRQLDEVTSEIAAPGTKFGSPTSRQAAIDMVLQRYALTMTAEQLRLGVDTIRDDRTGNKSRGPKLLTNAQANAYVDQFNQGGANAADLVSGLEQFYGKYWPQVFAQLAADGRMPEAALVIPNMRTGSGRALLAAVSTMKPAELEALVKPGDMPVIKEETLKAFAAAQPSFVAQGPGGNQTLGKVLNQAEKLAAVYVSRGLKPKAAAERAFDDTVGWQYQWVDTSSPMAVGGREEHYRVPKKFNGASLDADQVQRGANATIEDLIKSGGTKVFDGAAPQLLTDDALRFRSMWVTNRDETGLELRMRGADGSYNGVEGADGRPITKSWTELTKRASTARALDNSREGTSEWMRRHQEDLNPRRENPQMSKEQRDRMYGIKR